MSPGHLVGREREFARLRATLADARAGRSRVALMEGDAGMGKTALLRAVLDDAADAADQADQEPVALHALWASGAEAEAGLPFGVVGQLFAAMSEPLPPGDSLTVGAALLECLGVLEHDAAVVVVVDDLHWIDPESAGALLFCLRRLRADTVAVLLASRVGQTPTGDGWSRLLADDVRVTRTRLRGLDSGEVRLLALGRGAAIGEQAADRLARHTGGNPLYVSALLTELPARTLEGVDTPLPAPREYSASIQARLRRLSPAAQELVCAAAVLGVRVPAHTVAETAGIGDLASALDEAVRAELLTEQAPRSGSVLVFPHALLRAAVYEGLGAARRRALHLAVASAIGPGEARFEHRVAATAGGFDPALARELAAAAQEVATADPARAGRYLEWASRVDDDRARASDCLLAAVEHFVRADDVRSVIRLRTEVEACDPGYRRLFILAMLAAYSGHLDAAEAGLRAAVQESERAADLQGLAMTTANLAMIEFARGDSRAGLEAAQRATAVAEAVPPARHMARQTLAWAWAHAGKPENTLSLLADRDGTRMRENADECDLLTIRGAVRGWVGDQAGAREDLGAVVRWHRSGAPVHDIAHAYAALAEAEYRSGVWDAATLHADASVSICEETGDASFLAYAHSVSAHICAARGQAEAAAEHAERTAEATLDLPASGSLASRAMARAFAACALGDWDEVAVALEPINDGEYGNASLVPNLALWRVLMAEAQLHAGRLEQARALRAEIPAATAWGGICASGLARVDASLRLAVGNVQGALRIYQAALPVPPAKRWSDGLLALDYGRLLAQQGRMSEAAAVLRRGRDDMLRLGAEATAAECGRVLAECGIPLPAVSDIDQAVASLTARERTVAWLAARGMTNRQIASELYVSVKAVEFHLGHVFAKLGIASRRQLPAVPGLVPAARGELHATG